MAPIRTKVNKVVLCPRLYLLLVILSCYQYCAGQAYVELGISGGMVFYQGDLSPSSIRGSVSGGHSIFGISAAIYPVKFIGLEFFANKGELSGSDSNSLSAGRKERNLSFESPLHEFGSKLNFELPIRLTRDNDRLSPFVSIGYARVLFNPKTRLNGQMVALQALGTEGQGLGEESEDFYKLSTWAVPLSAGIRFLDGNNWSISILFSQSFSGTDYIDDVSRNYPDLELIEQVRGSMIRSLSDRSIGGDTDRSGLPRGDPSNRDSYFSATIKIGKIISFRGRNRFGRKQRGVMKCPKF